jgi:hypothetical protein
MRRLPILLALILASAGLTVVPGVIETAAAAPPNTNCTTDVTRDMQQFVSSGGVHQLVAGACYKVNGKLKINGILDGGDPGNKAEIRKTSQASLGRYDGMDPTQWDGSSLRSLQNSGYCGNPENGLVQLSGGAGIRDVYIHRQGLAVYNACHYNEHGIDMHSGPNTITNVDIEGAWGDCVYIQGGHDLEATNIDCISNGRQGVGLARGSNLHFNGLTIRNSDRSGFDFEANVVNDVIQNVEVENFDITTDDDDLGWPRPGCGTTCFSGQEGLPDSLGSTDTGKLAFPSQGGDSTSGNINIHDGTVHKALGGVYNRSSSPRTGPGQCAHNRYNWKVERVTFEGMGTQESPGYGLRTEGPTRINANGPEQTGPDTFGGPRAMAIFCGTKDVIFRDNKMPGGWLTLESNSGTQIVTGNCFAGITKIGNNGPVTQESNNTIKDVGESCGGGTVTKPGAPIIRTAVAGDGEATVNWSPPTNTGGGAITEYTVTRSPGGVTQTDTASPHTFTGLTNGTSYTFKVKAKNSAGYGPDSTASNPVTPRAGATVPGAPTGVTCTSGADGRSVVSFTAPSSNGGSAITGYKVTSTPGSIAKTGTASPITITGLTNGQAYTFKVAASNAIGEGSQSSASASCTPAGGNSVPGAPTIGTAIAGDKSAVVKWTAPVSNGGAAINAYIVYNGFAPVAYTGGSATQLTVQNLTNEQPYTFVVKAQNAVGLSAASAESNEVIPTDTGAATVPGAPTIGTATAGDASATVTWTPPDSDGGRVITGYKITSNPATTTKTASPGSSSFNFTGLTNGTSYTFTVKASNVIGDSSASGASNSVTPTTVTPTVVPCDLQDFAFADGLRAAQVDRINDQMGDFCRAVRNLITGSYVSSTPVCDNLHVDTTAGLDPDGAVQLESGLRTACSGLRGLAALGTGLTTTPATPTEHGSCNAVTFTVQTGMDTNRTERAEEAARNLCDAFQRVVSDTYDTELQGPPCDNATVTPPEGTTSPVISAFAAAVAQVGWRTACGADTGNPGETICDVVDMDAVAGLVPGEVSEVASTMRDACVAARQIDTGSYDSIVLGPICSNIAVLKNPLGLSPASALRLQRAWRDACTAARTLDDAGHVGPAPPPECDALQLTPLPGTDPADYQLALDAMREACQEALG